MKLTKQKLEQLIKENFPSEMPTGPSLGRFDSNTQPSIPERQRKIMALIELVGEKLDELQFYEKAYTRRFSAMFKDLKPSPKLTKPNQYGERFFVKGPDGKIVHETLDETAAAVAKKHLQGVTGTNFKSFKKYHAKTISQATQVAEIFEEINQYLVLIETLELDKQLALHAKEHIFKFREIRFPDAGVQLFKLSSYGDYIAATGLAIKHLSKIAEGLADPNLGEYIRTGALSFSENFNALSEMMSEEMVASGDYLVKRTEFVEAIEPEILKYMMKMGHPVSIYDLRNEGFYEEMMKKHPITGGAELKGFGGAKVMLRKALHSLIKKGYIVQDDPSESHRGMRTTFSINPQMAQQAGEEYFPKPNKIMEMKLTTKKLESLILEMMGRNFNQYDHEQEKKILALIRKTRKLMLDIVVIQGFFPIIINVAYSYDEKEDIHKAIRNSVKLPNYKKEIMRHYRAIQKIAEILEEVNQYLVLLETLEIEGNIAFIAQGMVYGGLSGPTTAPGHRVKLEELANMVDTGITFLEDVEAAVPGLLGEGNLGLEAMRDIVDSFHNNYSDLKD